MDNSYESSNGQQGVIVSAALVAKIAHLCELSQLKRAWYGHFDRSLRQVDLSAAIKGHDIIVDSAIASRQIARELGITLPDVSKVRWELAPRPVRAGTEF
jgi:hypothetical protein